MAETVVLLVVELRLEVVELGGVSSTTSSGGAALVVELAAVLVGDGDVTALVVSVIAIVVELDVAASVTAIEEVRVLELEARELVVEELEACELVVEVLGAK